MKKIKNLKHRLGRFFKKHPVIREIIIVVVILVVVYFTFQAIMMLALGTSTPLCAVISNSMKHNDDSWQTYFSDRGHDPSNFPFRGGFERGDLLVVRGVDVKDIAIGDVIVFQVPGRQELTHRVVEKLEVDNQLSFRTKGDANRGPDTISIKPEWIKGRAIFVIPKIGHISLWLQGK